MTAGVTIIKGALQEIGVHSLVAPAAPESITLGMNKLNSMLEMWLTLGFKIGFTPLKAPADDLGEPADATNGIISNLAIVLSPSFNNGKQIVSPELRIEARVGFQNIKNLYQTLTIPKKVVSSTLPLGAGNRHGSRVNGRIFKPVGGTVNG